MYTMKPQQWYTLAGIHNSSHTDTSKIGQLFIHITHMLSARVIIQHSVSKMSIFGMFAMPGSDASNPPVQLYMRWHPEHFDNTINSVLCVNAGGGREGGEGALSSQMLLAVPFRAVTKQLVNSYSSAMTTWPNFESHRTNLVLHMLRSEQQNDHK